MWVKGVPPGPSEQYLCGSPVFREHFAAGIDEVGRLATRDLSRGSKARCHRFVSNLQICKTGDRTLLVFRPCRCCYQSAAAAANNPADIGNWVLRHRRMAKTRFGLTCAGFIYR